MNQNDTPLIAISDDWQSRSEAAQSLSDWYRHKADEVIDPDARAQLLSDADWWQARATFWTPTEDEDGEA